MGAKPKPRSTLEGHSPGTKFVVQDYFDGHIKGSKQVPSEKFSNEAEIDRVIKGLPSGTEVVVVHCMLSQIRGPKCAKRCAF